jgi:hypothetical protein
MSRAIFTGFKVFIWGTKKETTTIENRENWRVVYVDGRGFPKRALIRLISSGSRKVRTLQKNQIV